MQNNANEVAATTKVEQSPSNFKVILNEFRKDKVAVVSLFLAVFIILAAFIGSLMFNVGGATQVNILDRYMAPGTGGYILGTDEGGRDMFKYLFFAARNSITIGISVALIIEFVGVVLGTISGYFGGLIDAVIMRLVDFWMIIPSLLVIIVLVTIIPQYNVITIILIMAAFYWMTTTRLMRSLELSEARSENVMASKTSATPNDKIKITGVLPIITDLTLTIASSIGIETALSFLGFGLPMETPSLGTLIGYASNPDLIFDRWWVWFPAVLVLLTLSLSINFVGQALRRAADSRQRRG